jgi:high affinity Mn2+ porin
MSLSARDARLLLQKSVAGCFRRRLRVLAALLVWFLAWGAAARAQLSYDTGQDTVFVHSETSPFWISGQINSIFQGNPRFPAQYSGTNSFVNASKAAATVVFTLYTGLQLTRTTEILIDGESAGGTPLSQALGLAGFTNADAQRDPSLAWTPYLARAEVHQVIPLSNDADAAKRNPLSLLTSLPARRIDIYVGEFSLSDYFDGNSIAGNDHMQFMNWTVVDTGTYDYSSDTRGYTWGGVIDFVDRWWTFRFAEVLDSKRANGITLQKNLQDAHSENYELEFNPTLLAGGNTSLHLLAFTNFANLGYYHQANALFLGGQTPTPDLSDHPQRTALKYGFAINAEQDFTEDLRGFVRAGWNDGQTQSWQYSEVDQTVAFGGDLSGALWNRSRDKVGVAFVVNGISHDHREYLALGGLGLNLGDGRLTYGPEKIMETYYNFPIPLHSGLFAALDIQYFDDPGYNRARGPVVVLGARIHIEL